MNKPSIIALSLIALLSCTKSISVSDEHSDDVQTPALGNIFNAYGLKGDGYSDDSDALQKLVNDSSEIFLKAGIYIINRTINLKANLKIIGETGTVIKAGNAMQGSLLENGRYFFADRANNSIISNIKFKQSDKDFNFQEWNNSCVYLLNCSSFTVQKCTFEFHLKYQATGMEAVWVSGIYAKGNIIKGNEINSLGLRYAENGADSSLVENNTLTNSYSNALSATGNHASDNISGCMVLNNNIINAGRMGIEDWGNTIGTSIVGNIISGCGKDPNKAKDGIAISAVGINSSVSKNTIKDSQLYGIEVRGNYGAYVSSNVISNNNKATAIILNYTFPSPAENLPLAKVENNYISESKIGIHIFGDFESNASITGNSLKNILSKSISIESGSKKYLIELKKNHFLFSTPNDQDRFAIFSYTKFESGAENQIVTSTDDSINFSPSASGGKGVDFGVVVRTDNAKIMRLFVQGNNNKNLTQIPVNALTAFGAKPKNSVLSNNLILGGIVDLNGFINLTLINNNFVR